MESYTATRKLMAIVISLIGWIALHLLFITCKKHIFGKNSLDGYIRENNGKGLSGTWHRGWVFSLYVFRNLEPSVIGSASRDAELAMPLLRIFKFRVSRGSSGKNKGGSQALREFVKDINKGRIGGMALDGSQGPPYILKPGIVVAASRTGAPILLHTWYAKPCIRLRTWDKTIIPLPFSEVVAAFPREPVYVPKDASREEIENCRIEINKSILSLTYQVDHWFELRDKYPDPRDIPVPDSYIRSIL